MSWSLIDSELNRLDSFANLFEDLLNVRRGVLGGPQRWEAPAPLNVWAGEDDAVVTVELPGVDPSGIDVSLEGDALRISAERKAHELAEGERYHRRERYVGRLQRTLRLPFAVDGDAIEARYENGVLEVRLPRAAQDRPRRIEVKSS